MVFPVGLKKIISEDSWVAIHEHWLERVNDPKDHLQVVPGRRGFESVTKFTHLFTELAWPAREITDQQIDQTHFEERLTPMAQQIVYRIIAFFAKGDKLVNDMLGDTDAEYHGELLPLECELLDKTQEGQEVVHMLVYHDLIARCLPAHLQKKIFEEVELAEAVRSLCEWAKQYCSKDVPIFVRSAARTAFELVTFTAQFMVPHELKKNGLMPTFGNANERIAPDETNHAKAGMNMHRVFFSDALGTPPEVRDNANRVLEFILQSCYEAAQPLFEWIYEGGAHIGSISKSSALEYTQRTVNVMLPTAGARPIFDESNASTEVTEWLSSIMMERMSRTNFFEENALAYSKEYSATAFLVPEKPSEDAESISDMFTKMITI